LSARDTEATETPASRATSLIVATMLASILQPAHPCTGRRECNRFHKNL
jgi:hypothetical protein